jgi:spheroidene monooxygenase
LDPGLQTVSLSLFRFAPGLPRLWVLGQMALARIDFARMPQVRFWKLCGSGTGEGFTPRPNFGVWAILAVWDTEDAARDHVTQATVYCRWADRATETTTLFMRPASVRGQWSGVTPFTAQSEHAAGPLAALTRAAVRPGKLLKFWGRVPDISAVIGDDPNVIFKIGIGEVPMLHQVTFSVWPDAAAMAQFARGDGPHGRAIRAVREEGWFREELYARFHVLGSTGLWDGRDPLNPASPNLPPRIKDAA